MCKLCASRGLSNSIYKSSRELVYRFPIDAPFKLLCGDIYKTGDIKFHQEESVLFIIQDVMTEFTIIEKFTELNSVAVIKLAMKVLLQHRLCHTSIVDDNSKFKAFLTRL